MEAYQISLIVAFVLGICEMLMGAFIFLGMAIGCIAVALTQWIAGAFSLNRDLLVFSLVSPLVIWGLRKFFAKPNDQQATEDDVNQY